MAKFRNILGKRRKRYIALGMASLMLINYSLTAFANTSIFDSSNLVFNEEDEIVLASASDALENNVLEENMLNIENESTVASEDFDLEFATATETRDSSNLSLSASGGYAHNRISWQNVDTATVYKIYAKTNDASSFSQIGTQNAAQLSEYTYWDKNASQGVEKIYKVEAYNGSTLLSTSDEMQATPLGEEGLVDTAIINKEYSEDDMYFDGTRVDNLSEESSELGAILTGLKEGSVIIKFRPDEGVSYGEALFTVKDRTERAIKYSASTNLQNQKQASIYLWGDEDKTIRFALGHTQFNVNSRYRSGEWHTIVFSNTTTGSKILRASADGAERSSFGNPNGNKGFFSRIAGTQAQNMEVLIGGVTQLDGRGLRNAFKGDIKSVIVTEEIFSDADAIKLSKVYASSNTASLFETGGNKTWLFSGGRNTLGSYEDIKGNRNYVSYFEDAIRWRFALTSDDAKERFVNNIARENASITDTLAHYDTYINDLNPRALVLMVEENDLTNIPESLNALKDLLIRNSEADRYSIILLPVPVAGNEEQILEYKAGITRILTEIENDNADYRALISLIDTPQAFVGATEYLGENGYLNAKGHLLLAKYLTKQTIQKTLNIADSSLTQFEREEVKVLDTIPNVVAATDSLSISGISTLGIENPRYEIRLDDGRFILGDIEGDTIEVSGIHNARSYALRLLNDNKASRYVYGRFEEGSVASELDIEGRSALQEEIDNKLLEKVDGAKWLFVGDGLTQAGEKTVAYDDITEAFDKYLKEDLQREKDVVLNTAIGGQNTSEFLQNIERRYSIYDESDFVIMMFGTEDSRGNEVPIEDFKNNLVSFIDRVRADGAVPIIRIPASLGEVAGDWAGTLVDYAQAIYEVANEKNVLVINHYSTWEEETSGSFYLKNVNGYLQSDFVNLNGRGQYILFKQLVAGLFEGYENSKMYNVLYPIKMKQTKIKVEPKLNNDNNSITLSPSKLADQSSRGDLGRIRLLAKSENGQIYKIEASRNENGRFEEFSLSNLPRAKYSILVEADLYRKPETLIFAERKIDLNNIIQENELSTLVDIEDVILDGDRNNVIDMPNKANAIKALDATTLHFRYKIDDFRNTSNGAQALLAFSDSRNQTSGNTYGAFYVNPTTNVLGIELKNSGSVVYNKEVVNAGIADKSWHNLSYIFTPAGGLKIYLDGILKVDEASVPALSSLNSTDILRLGEIGRNTNPYSFIGKFAIARVYNRALSVMEVMELHSATSYLPNETIPESAVKTDDISLFYRGLGGSSNYRIPSLFTTKNGVVIGAIDKRNTGAADMGNIDTAIRRSFDNGRTWQEIQVLLDIPGKGNSLYPYLIDPVMFEDDETGRLYLMVDMYPESGGLFNPAANELGDGKIEVEYNGVRKKYPKLRNRSTNEVFFIDDTGVVRKVSDNSATTYTVPNYFTGELFNNGNRAGSIFVYTNGNNWAGDLTVDKTSYLWLITSDNDGETWSAPVDITADVKAPWMSFLGLGPGVGIQLKNGPHKGRMLLSVYSINPYGGLGSSQAAHVIYSDDKGLTWKRGESVVDGNVVGGEVQNSEFMEEANNQVTESQVVEVGDNGTLKMFSRNVNPRKRVRVSTSHDGGETWADEIVFDDTLLETYCQLSIVKYPNLINGKEAFVFSNPASTNGRVNGTVRVGFYDQETDSFDWPHSKLIKEGSFAYSCATVMQNGDIGVLYENTAEDIRFTSMSMDWLMYEKGGNRAEVNMEDASFEKIGNQLEISIQLDQEVVKFGDVSLLLEVDGVQRSAKYVSGDNSNKLYFELSLPENARDIKLIGVRTKDMAYIGNANNKAILDREFLYTLEEEIEEPESPQEPDTPQEPDIPQEPDTPRGPSTPNVPTSNTSSSGGSGGAAGIIKGKSATSLPEIPLVHYVKYTSNKDGAWKEVDSKNHIWQFVLNDGSMAKGFVNIETSNNGMIKVGTYHFDASGNMTTSWYKDDKGNWYYLSDKNDESYGRMYTGWIKDTKDNSWYYLDPVTGIMRTGWQNIAGIWYYLNPVSQGSTWFLNPLTSLWDYSSGTGRPLGTMYLNERTPDGYFVNENGAWIEGR